MLLSLMIISALLGDSSRLYLLSPEIDAPRDALVQVQGDHVYVLNRVGRETADKTDGDMMSFAMWDLGTDAEHRLHIPQSQVERSHFISFHVGTDTIVVQDMQQILVFKRTVSNEYQLIDSKDLGAGYFRGRVVDDSLIVYNDVRLSMSDRPSQLFRSSISVRSLEEGPVTEYQEAPDMDLMFVQPRTVMDCGERLVAIADPAEYRVRVQDRIGGQMWTLSDAPALWRRQDTLPPRIAKDDHRLQAKFGPLMNFVKANSVITSVAVLNDNTICMNWSAPHATERRVESLVYDLWRRANDVWTLRDQRVVPIQHDEDAPYKISDTWTRIIDRHHNEWRIDLVPYPGDRITTTSWSSKAAYNAACDEYFTNHDLRYALVLNRIDHVEQRELVVHSLDNKQTVINDTAAAIILHGPISCASCFGQLASAIRTTDPTLKIIGLLKPPSTRIVDRRQKLQRARNLFQADSYYFDAVDSSAAFETSDQGIFGEYSIYQTPCLILKSRDGVRFYDFQSLFHGKDSESADADYVKQKIDLLLKPGK